MGRRKINLVFLAAAVLVAALFTATAAYAGGASLPPCYNRVQDVGEAGVDCGGSCVRPVSEVCDGLDNDLDCVVDELEVCGVKKGAAADAADGASGSGEGKASTVAKGAAQDKVCAPSEKRVADEGEPFVNVISPPSCVIASGIGGLAYAETINLTKMLNTLRNRNDQQQSIMAMYRGSSGRCAATFTRFKDELAAHRALADGISNAQVRSVGGVLAYINETHSFAAWVKGYYVVTTAPYFDYTSSKSDNEDCTALMQPYLARTGSDLLLSKPASEITAQAGTGIVAEVMVPAEMDDTEITQAHDEEMAMQCDYIPENNRVMCRKVKASGAITGTMSVETAAKANGEQVAAAAFGEGAVGMVRRVAGAYNITLPENDKELLGKLEDFRQRHSKELSARYGKAGIATDEQLAEVLRQFSAELLQAKQDEQQVAQARAQPKRESVFAKVARLVASIFR